MEVLCSVYLSHPLLNSGALFHSPLQCLLRCLVLSPLHCLLRCLVLLRGDLCNNFGRLKASGDGRQMFETIVSVLQTLPDFAYLL